MLEKKEQNIRNLLENDAYFMNLEKQLEDQLTAKDEYIELFNELQQAIIEKAYIKGYSDGIKLYDQIQEEPEKHLTISQLDKINREMEELKKPATKKIAGLK